MANLKYAFDPEFTDLIAALPTQLGDLSDPGAIRESRTSGMANLLGEQPDREGVAKRDLTVPGRDGDPEVPVRVYHPKAEADGLRGALVYIHGGGFMLGSVDMFDAACQEYAQELDAVVVSVEYRLAPEDPYPAGVEDCYAALVWTAAHAGELGVDPARIAVGGGSAGGGLSAAVALMARDRGGPALCFQLLQIPELDDRLQTPSMTQFTDTPLWNRPNAVWSWKHYLGDLYGADDVPYYAAPSRCQDLSGLPPAYVTTMEFDPLRDEGIQYAMDLMRDGVQVELHSYPGTFHGSAIFGNADVSRRDHADSIRALNRALNG
ncbi:alpha/beta hydrolase [Candidatus Poriferisocius sp.]|uniref:alpha/beta hydrolase n=1 Tax=Candidatus Poriferisocius sp. TaxID=3101276 RepID=UPI003B5945E1